MNGLMAIVLGFSLTALQVGPKAENLISLGIAVAVWGNAMFYLFSMFSHNRGLTLGENVLGASNWAGVVAFLPALLGAISLMCSLSAMLYFHLLGVQEA
ncbi:MAG: hypothetical protein P1U47_12320 [Zhongshania sp.]|uniref:hypothetical protein n=1 Tax=Zhongshania sp. TaxID=1971902 RepID=UPI0026340985|nr:hypothetical protein [Zhongshania sp.]MDF1693156.1 hypothetical protein [Zhongshania sp.]